MEGPSGEKSKVPAEEMSVELIRSSEEPGVRRGKNVHSPDIADQEQGGMPKLRERQLSKIGEIVSRDVGQHPSKIRGLVSRHSKRILGELAVVKAFQRELGARGGYQHPSKISEVIDWHKEEEERPLVGGLTHETTEGFVSEQSYEETSKDSSSEDNDNNNRDSSAAKSQNDGEIEEPRDDCLPSLPVKEPSQAEESSSGISTSAGGGVLGLETNTTNQQSVPFWRKLGIKAFLKWVFVVLNLVVEVCQATLTQEAAQGKLRHQIYLNLSIATSSFCLVMSLVEAFLEGRSSGVKWQRRGYCGWFYDTRLPGRLFGRFSLYFGIICSMVQLLVNLITKLIGEDFAKFDYVPLLLSACYLVARIIASENKTDCLPVVNSDKSMAKTVDDGKTSLYECSKCQEDIP